MQPDPGVTYYGEGRTVLCAYDYDYAYKVGEYQVRTVCEMPSEQGATIRARVLQRVAEMDSAQGAREIEATL